MKRDSDLALFLMLGQTATKEFTSLREVPTGEALYISDEFNLSETLPDEVRRANNAALGYRLFFVFENYLREFVVATLSKDGKEDWWDKVPSDVQGEVERIEQTEEDKAWMALGSRDKSQLLTYPQLLRIIDCNWKESFQDIVRDKALVQQGRLISHLRNTVCHMTEIGSEEMERICQVMRDWFRVVAP